MALPVESDGQKEAKIKAVKDIYVEMGVDEDARQAIAQLHKQAMQAVEQLNLGNIRYEALHRYADTLLGRKK